MNGQRFESKRFEGTRFMVKPAPQTFTLEAAYDPEECVELAHRIREEQQAFAASGVPSVPIGGEIWAWLVRRNDIRLTRLHRFADYDESLTSYV